MYIYIYSISVNNMSFPLPPCRNSIYNRIRFPPTCVHTAAAAAAAASDGRI